MNRFLEKLQRSCQFTKVKISGEMLRNGGKRAAVNRTKFSIPASRGGSKGQGEQGVTQPSQKCRVYVLDDAIL